MFLESINWTSLIQRASAQRNRLDCRLLPDVGLGYNHLVRVIEFADHIRWVARLRMPPLTKTDDEAANTRTIMKSECRMISLVQRESNIPLPGNAGIDLSINLPPEHKLDVYAQIADIQLELFHIRLPKIGKVFGLNEDGTYRQEPLPILGGPFDTAAEFFRAWSTKVEFGLSEAQLRDATGPYAEEISLSLSAFREWVNDNAESLSVHNTGPFPLSHGDFGHNNMVFDDNYRLLSVIDWETAFAGPYEVSCEFPLSISVVPPAMDVPWKYDEMGCPKDPEERQKFYRQGKLHLHCATKGTGTWAN